MAGIASAAADEEVTGYHRSPSDVIRLIAYGTAALTLAVLTRWATSTVTAIEHDLANLVDINQTIERLLTGSAQLVVGIVAIAVFVPAFVLRRYRLLGYIVFGNILTAGLVQAVQAWLRRANLTTVAREATRGLHVTIGVLDPRGLANIACSFIILAPFVSVRWRRTGAILITAFTVVRLMVSHMLPDDLFLALAIGATSGCVVLLALGRPERRPTDTAVRAALLTSGLPEATITNAPDAEHASPMYTAALDDGSRVSVRVINPADRSADLLYRSYRFLRWKDVGDERPFSSLRRGVEHEALVALQARDIGARVPRLRAVANVGTESMLLAYDEVEGTTLADLDGEAVSDAVLHELWEQLGILRRHRIAHRALQRTNIVVDRDAHPWLLNFAFSEIAAADSVLDADFAQLLTATALSVGVERAVAAAAAVFDAETLGRSVPLLQAAALRSATRTALRDQHGLLDDLRVELAGQAGIDQPHEVQLERFSRRTILMFGSLALATYFLLPQFSDLNAIFNEVGDADWWWFPAVLAMSGVTYVGATLAISGAVPQRIPVAPTFVTQIGSSFTAVLAPAGIGGMALNTRFLQRSGVESAVAVSSVGLMTVSGFAMHILLLILFVVWAGSSAFHAISLPDPVVFLYGIAAVVAIAAIVYAIPVTRAQVRKRVLPALREAGSGLARTFRRPAKLLLLFGGATLVSTGYILALFLATQAFGGNLPFARVGAVFLVGAAIATVAPTPGGLGALEAALIAGLVAGGMENAVAVPAVFLYRLATFWLPIAPGWLAFRWLQRADYV